MRSAADRHVPRRPPPEVDARLSLLPIEEIWKLVFAGDGAAVQAVHNVGAQVAQQEQRAERSPGDVSRDMVALSVEESDGLVIENVGEVLADDDEGRGRGALAAGDRDKLRLL